MRILIVEDDSDIREMYTNLFSDSHITVDETADGESLRLLNENKYDAVLLDLMFPNQEGTDIIRQIRRKGSLNELTPVIVLTNLDKGEKIKKALELGADLCLLKAQYTPKEVYREVMHLLQSNS